MMKLFGGSVVILELCRCAVGLHIYAAVTVNVFMLHITKTKIMFPDVDHLLMAMIV